MGTENLIGATDYLSMAIGFVLINVAPASEHDIYDRLIEIDDITELYPLFGEYDFIARVEAATPTEIGGIVVNKIRSLEGVADTKTLTTASINR